MKNAALKILFVLLFMGVFSPVFSQTKDEVIQQRVELMAENLETEEINLEDFFDALYHFYDNPLNINVASYADFNELFLLSDLQINELLTVREKKGGFSTIYELIDLSLWSAFTLEQINPFIIVVPVGHSEELQSTTVKDRIKEKTKTGKTETYLRWMRGVEDRAGYADVPDSIKEQSSSYYWGSPDRLYSRVRYTSGRSFSAGVTVEKDPGEALGGPTQPQLFDFYSAHLYYNNEQQLLQTVALGDYQLEIGQGLAMWTGYAFGKTNDATGVYRKPRGIRAYTSADEQRFMRGGAVQIGTEKYKFLGWYSSKGIDGTLQLVDTLEGQELFSASSINATGLHRTTSELNRKNSIKEVSYGAQVKAKWKGFDLGISAVHFEFDTPINPANRPVNAFVFRGSQLTNLSLDYAYRAKKLLLFGEVAQSLSSNAFAHINGISWALDKRFALSLVHRNYAKDYHTVYSRGFGEFSRTSNEVGTYLGVQSKLSKKLFFNAYADVFKRPWLSFRVDTPNKGHEYFAQLRYQPTKKLQLEWRYRAQEKMINVSTNSDVMRPTEEFTHQLYRFNLRYAPKTKVQWKMRIDYVTDDRKSRGRRVGTNVAQDLSLAVTKNLKFTASYAIFNTDDFDTRIYVYEHHLQNVFSIPVYFNQGSRLYGMVQYKFLGNRAVVWLRYGAFFFANQNTIGNGPELIEGNRRSDIAVQLKLKL